MDTEIDEIMVPDRIAAEFLCQEMCLSLEVEHEKD